MFWRKKSDGFEWHKYVRTTIKLRREDRRRRIDDFKGAAAKGVAGAGKASVSASVSLLDRVGRVLALPFEWIGRGLVLAGSMLAAGARRLADALRGPLMPLASALERNNAAPLLAMAAVVAGLLSAGRTAVSGFDEVAQIEAAVAAACVVALLLPPLLTGRGPKPMLDAFGRLSRWRPSLRVPAGASTLRRGLGALVLAAAVVMAGWLGLSTVTRLPAPSLAALPRLSSEVVSGRAVALSGDTIRIDRRVLRLAGIDAPEAGQSCSETAGKRSKPRTWRCGASAQKSLRDLVRGDKVSCELTGSAAGAHPTATCKAGGKDIAAELVREGHVFAQAGVFSTYGRLELDARNAKLGIWRGEAERPEDYRKRVWAMAKRSAPDGCPIKGRIASGKRVYVVPWAPTYRRVRVSERQGGRWFCSEQEALAAGWSPGDRS